MAAETLKRMKRKAENGYNEKARGAISAFQHFSCGYWNARSEVGRERLLTRMNDDIVWFD
jgi:hypothetical protein